MEEDGADRAKRLNQAVEDAIAGTGWFVQLVLPDASAPSFAYTIGLTETFGHPELLMIGFRPDLMHQILNIVGGLVKAGGRFEEWDTSEKVISSFPVVFRTVPDPVAGEWALGAAARYANTGFGLLQVFLPDMDGRFPWDTGCEPRAAAMQGVLLEHMAKRVS